ncbi:TOBE domain-containing protein, partial [Candidatus Thorarchaeota archaeon]
TLDRYPFQEGEHVRCAVRPEDLHIRPQSSDDNEITGTVSQVIYVGSNIEVYFSVGTIHAVASLPPEFDAQRGNEIRLYAPRDQMMVLPLGGVDALRKIPGHPLYADPDEAMEPA